MELVLQDAQVIHPSTNVVGYYGVEECIAGNGGLCLFNENGVQMMSVLRLSLSHHHSQPTWNSIHDRKWLGLRRLRCSLQDSTKGRNNIISFFIRQSG
jgi:hypothetical protein